MAFIHSPKISTDGLVLYLDAANIKSYVSGSTTWRDLSGNNYSGSLTNGPVFSNDGNGSILFDGTNDYVTISNPQQLNPGSNSFTIEYWCRMATTIGPTSGSCALEARSSTLYGFLCIAYRNNGQMQLFLNDSATPSQNVYGSTTTPVQINVWNHQTMVVDRATQQITFYYNGQQTGNKVTITDTGSIDPGSDYKYWVGGDLGGTPMEGNIANIRHYSRALTAQEVLQNFNAARSRFGV